MNKIVGWVVGNKEWLFSGTGLMLILWVGKLLFKKKQISTQQSIHSGNNSINIQVGRNVDIGTKKRGNDGKEK